MSDLTPRPGWYPDNLDPSVSRWWDGTAWTEHTTPSQVVTVVRRPTNSNAVVSLVLGIVWVFGLASIAAVILGHVALRQIRERGEEGRGMAVAGLVLGYIGVFPWVMFLFWLVLGGLVSAVS
jgi:hypothetical protein